MDFLEVVHHFCEALEISQATFTLFVKSRDITLDANGCNWKVSRLFVVDEDYVLRCFTMCGLMWLHQFQIAKNFSTDITQITAPLMHVCNVISKRTLAQEGPGADFARNANTQLLRFNFGFRFCHFQMFFTNGH